MTDNTKLVRIESIVDRVLAYLITLPAPVTSIIVAANLLGAFLAGWWVGR